MFGFGNTKRLKAIETRLKQMGCDHRDVDISIKIPPDRFANMIFYEKTCKKCGKHMGYVSRITFLHHLILEKEAEINRIRSEIDSYKSEINDSKK